MTGRIIGVSGYMRTGKDSVAKLLIENFGYTRVSFADPLRKVAADVDPYIVLNADDLAEPGQLPQVDPDLLRDLDIEPYDGTYAARYSFILERVGYERAKEVPDFRRYLQRLGTEGVRENFGMNAWVDMAVKTIQGLPEGTNVVLPDVRFPNEAQAVKDLGGEVWRTERPGYEGGTHPSEAMVAKITPDITLRAATLLDTQGHEETDEEGNTYFVPAGIGLGTLVLQQLGVPRERHAAILKPWAESILGVPALV